MQGEWIVWQSLAMVLVRVLIVWLVMNAKQSLLVAVLSHAMSDSVWGLLSGYDPIYDPIYDPTLL